MPLTVLNGPLSVVAMAELGGLGPNTSEPVPIEWQWYYHLPSFAGWALIAVLFVLVKENRDRRALTILIPLLLLSEVLWPWIERLLSCSGMNPDQLGPPLQWLLAAWTAVWLLSPWLARRRPILAFALAWLLTAGIGAAAETGLYRRLVVGEALMIYLVCTFALLTAFALSGLCCRNNYRPRRFLIWLAPWLVVGVIAGFMFELVRSLVGRGLPPSGLPYLLPRVAVVSLCTAGVLYVLNLPFMYVLFRCPLYRDRFQKLLRLQPVAPPTTGEPDACGEGKCELS